MTHSDKVREIARIYANPAVEAVLSDLVDRVVRSAAPERIALFGSAADGRCSAQSELDVLVVKSGRYRKLTLLQEIPRALRGFSTAGLICWLRLPTTWSASATD